MFGLHQQKYFYRSVMVAFLLCTAGTSFSADSPNPARALGANTVGSSLADVQQYRKSENCLLENGNADCSFTDQNGVSYVVFGKSVIAVVAESGSTSSKLTLPYGLKFGDGLEQVLRKLVSAGDDLWLVGSDHESGIAISSYKRYVGKNGVRFNVELRFSSEKLTAVKYNSGTI